MADDYMQCKLNFFEKFVLSFKTLLEGFRVLFRYPIMFLPIIFTFILECLLFAGAFFVIYHLYSAMTPETPVDEAKRIFLYIILGIIFAQCLIYSISSFLQLEFIQQIETGNKISVSRAFYETFFKDLIKGLPVVIVWAVVCFVIYLLRGKNSKQSPVLRFLFNTSAELVENGLRMSVFFIFPAIAWEDKRAIEAAKRGLKMLKNNFASFSFGVIQMSLITLLLTLPWFIIMFCIFCVTGGVTSAMMNIIVELSLAIYCIFVFHVCLYIEQMFAANIYMWNKRWEKAVINAIANKKTIPTLYDIQKPSLLDDVPDLL